MSRHILFLAGPDDLAAFEAFAEASGLKVLPFNLTYPESPRCGWLAPTALADFDLHMGVPIPSRNPVLPYDCGRIEHPYFAIGRLKLDFDYPDAAAVLKSHFDRLSRWIRKNWPKSTDAWSLYCGPQALELLGTGLKIVNVIPREDEREPVQITTRGQTAFGQDEPQDSPK